MRGTAADLRRTSGRTASRSWVAAASRRSKARLPSGRRPARVSHAGGHHRDLAQPRVGGGRIPGRHSVPDHVGAAEVHQLQARRGPGARPGAAARRGRRCPGAEWKVRYRCCRSVQLDVLGHHPHRGAVGLTTIAVQATAGAEAAVSQCARRSTSPGRRRCAPARGAASPRRRTRPDTPVRSARPGRTATFTRPAAATKAPAAATAAGSASIAATRPAAATASDSAQRARPSPHQPPAPRYNAGALPDQTRPREPARPPNDTAPPRRG